jgi:maleylacetoacetate isomerase
MILYDYWRSSASYRVRIALNLKGLEVERRHVHLRRGEQSADAYRKLNAQGLVPTLVVDGRRITQSLAIIEYLDERQPAPPLLPEGLEDRAWVRATAQSIACDIHPLDNTRVMAYLERTLGLEQARRDEWYRHWIEVGFQALEAQLAERGAGRFCFGNGPTLADICLVPQVANSQRVNMDLAPYPRIRAINDHCLTLPAFDRARPALQPDAE